MATFNQQNHDLVVEYGKKIVLEITDAEDGTIEQCVIILVDDNSDSIFDSEKIQKVSANTPLGKAIYKKPTGYCTSYSVNGYRSNVRILGIL